MRLSAVGVTLRQLEDKEQEKMTRNKTLLTKPLKICDADILMLSGGLAETSKLLLQSCKSLFSLAAELGYKWDKKRQKWTK